ncbi:MAG: hypothetical protein JF606_19435 [Burkholderiales bacterium]|nr:hypothetical protein [Burkholderiales bacterium]
MQGVDSFPKYRLLGRLMQTADRQVSNCGQFTPKLVEAFASMLGLLSPHQQERLVSATIDFPNSRDKADAIAALSAKVAHLNEGQEHLSDSQREKLVVAAIGPGDNTLQKAHAIAGLGAGVAHLSEFQRERLVVAALGFGDGFHKAVAIAGLSAGAAHLNDFQRERLVAAAISLDDVKPQTIAALAASIS